MAHEIETKVLLFDVDGVIIRGPKEKWSTGYAKEVGIPAEKMDEFFKGDFKLCSIGKADLKEKITPFLTKWKWRGNADEFLAYWFENDSNIDEKLLEEIKKIRAGGIRCYVATQQEKYRKNYLWEKLGLKNYFDGIFCTCDIGYEKFTPKFFNFIFRKLKVKPEEIMFFDDKRKGAELASKLGVRAYVYENIEGLKKQTELLLRN